MATKLKPATYAQALDMFAKSIRLGREALAAREEVSRILGFDMDGYQRDCIDEAVIEALYADPPTDAAVEFESALAVAGVKKP